MKNMKYGALCFVPTILILVFWNQLPDTLAIHFNYRGDVDTFGDKWTLALLIPCLGCIIHIFYMLILDKKPEWIGRKGFRKYSFLYMPITTACIVAFMIWVNR